MTGKKHIDAKICGIRDPEALGAAVEGGATYVGFAHFEKSRRYVSLDTARALAARLPGHVEAVVFLVDPADDLVREAAAFADWIQLHGQETAERCRAVRTLAGKPVLKAVSIGEAEDLKSAAAYAGAADMILLDAKPPAGDAAALLGGNGIAFDWRLLQNAPPDYPWMLAGGLNAGNVAEACRLTGATRVDVSSGVEIRPGEKSPDLIRAFLKAVKQI